MDHLIEETNSAYHALSHSRMVLRYQHALSRDGISGDIDNLSYDSINVDRLETATRLYRRLEYKGDNKVGKVKY